MSPLTKAGHCEKHESNSGEVLRTPSASFRIYGKATMARAAHGGQKKRISSDLVVHF